jgi:hypothetical protein
VKRGQGEVRKSGYQRIREIKDKTDLLYFVEFYA